jgi:hypothetical protein
MDIRSSTVVLATPEISIIVFPRNVVRFGSGYETSVLEYISMDLMDMYFQSSHARKQTLDGRPISVV